MDISKFPVERLINKWYLRANYNWNAILQDEDLQFQMICNWNWEFRVAQDTPRHHVIGINTL